MSARKGHFAAMDARAKAERVARKALEASAPDLAAALRVMTADLAHAANAVETWRKRARELQEKCDALTKASDACTCKTLKKGGHRGA